MSRAFGFHQQQSWTFGNIISLLGRSRHGFAVLWCSGQQCTALLSHCIGWGGGNLFRSEVRVLSNLFLGLDGSFAIGGVKVASDDSLSNTEEGTILTAVHDK